MAMAKIDGNHPVNNFYLGSITPVTHPVMKRRSDHSNPYRSSATLKASPKSESFLTQKFLAILLSISSTPVSFVIYLYHKIPNTVKKVFNHIVDKDCLGTFRDIWGEEPLSLEPMGTESYVKLQKIDCRIKHLNKQWESLKQLPNSPEKNKLRSLLDIALQKIQLTVLKEDSKNSSEKRKEIARRIIAIENIRNDMKSPLFNKSIFKNISPPATLS